LEEIISCKEGELIPTPSLTRDCKLCEWLNYCTESTKEHGDLSIISGIGEIIKEELSKLGICSIYDLANQDPNLLELDSATKEEVHYFVLQAQSFVDKKPIFRDSHRFKEREYELFVDVEGSPHHDFIWIIGCLVRNGEEIKFHPFVAKEPKDEERMFLDFLDFIDNLPHSFTLYHWSHTEPHYFRKLRDKYILPSNSIDHLLRNTEDIFEIFKKKIILPVHSYTLKNVANAIGFTWHDPLMDGATSILLYDQWRKKNDVHALEKAISYNSDDCKALLIVKDYVDKMIAKTNS